MFLLGIGLGRSKRLILNHIFRGVTALILTSAVAQASDGEDLLKAASAGDLGQVRTLLAKGAEIDHQTNDGWTALMLSSQNGHEGIVQALLDKDANVNSSTEVGTTALFKASEFGYLEIIKTLIENGADVNQKSQLRCNRSVCRVVQRP